MPIQIICTQCGVKLNAPDSLAGKKGRCPKCQAVFRVPIPNQKPIPPVESTQATVPTPVKKSSQVMVSELPSLNPRQGFPKRFGLNNLYVILGPDRVIAFFKSSEGWLLNTGHGFVSARQESQLVPEQGYFTLLEGIVRITDNGRRLMGIQFFKVGGEGNLSAITRSHEEILEKLTGRTTLTLSQKRHFLSFLRDQYFSSFTEDAPEIIEYLVGEDFHSEQIGDCHCENTKGLPLAE